MIKFWLDYPANEGKKKKKRTKKKKPIDNIRNKK